MGAGLSERIGKFIKRHPHIFTCIGNGELMQVALKGTKFDQIETSPKSKSFKFVKSPHTPYFQ